jgi:hypothetical protein
MSAFAAAFLADNPFEQAPGTTTDSLGNIFNAAGYHIGVKPGSIADQGSSGAAVAAGAAAVPATPGPAGTVGAAGSSGSTDSAGSWASVKDKLASFLSKATGLTAIEDILFIVIGLILVAAAIFSLKPVRDVVVTAGKAAMA